MPSLQDISQAIASLAFAVLVALVPYLISQLLPPAVAWFQSHTTVKFQELLEKGADLAVQAAEQKGFAKVIADKKAFALQWLSSYLAKRGLLLDVAALDVAIEAAVFKNFNWYRTHPVVPAPKA